MKYSRVKFALSLSVILGSVVMASDNSSSPLQVLLQGLKNALGRMEHSNMHLVNWCEYHDRDKDEVDRLKIDIQLARDGDSVALKETMFTHEPNWKGDHAPTQDPVNYEVWRSDSGLRAVSRVGMDPPYYAITYDPNRIRDRMDSVLGDDGRGSPIWGIVHGMANKTIVNVLEESRSRRLLETPEMIQGVLCYIIEGVSDYGTFKVWISPERSYNAVKWYRELKPGDRKWAVREDKLKKGELFCETYEVDKWAKVDDVYVVSQAWHESKVIFEGHENYARSRYEILSLDIKPDFASLRAFEFKIPDGARVSVNEAPGIRYVWENGKVVPDEEGLGFDDIDEAFDD